MIRWELGMEEGMVGWDGGMGLGDGICGWDLGMG